MNDRNKIMENKRKRMEVIKEEIKGTNKLIESQIKVVNDMNCLLYTSRCV